MIKNKRGITVAVVVTMVLVIVLLTTTITISVNGTLKSSKLRAFATEISIVQDTIDTYIKTTTAVDYIIKDVTVTPSSDVINTQFYGETVTDGKVLLHVIDIEKIGIEKTVYGKSKTETDVYAMSFETGKVYYVQGYDASDTIYYTLTDELENLLSGDLENDVISKNIIFTPNHIGWTNQPIQVKVSIPTAIDITTVNVTTNVASITISDEVLNGNYNEITVNTGNYAGNYTISVEYIEQGETKTQIYEVATYDNIAPIITSGEVANDNNNREYKYLNDVVATDSGKVKKIMYADIVLTEEEAKTYFQSQGNTVSNSRVRLNNTSAQYTIYAEDYAGNVATLIVDNKFWVAFGEPVKYTPTADPSGTYSGVTYVIDTETTSSTYNTFIESTTDYTPGTIDWLYFGQDANGNHLLISQDVTEFTVNIGGQDAWVTGPDRLDTLCNTLYGNSTYGVARNISREDINRVLEYDGPQGMYDARKSSSEEGEGWASSDTALTFDEIQTKEGVTADKLKTPRLSTTKFGDYPSNYYWYVGSRYKAATTIEYKILFKKADGTTNLPFYWLSSPSAYFLCYYIGACFSFDYVNQSALGSFSVFNSGGEEFYTSHAIRPVIVLDSNVQFGAKNASGEWTLVAE